MKKNLIKITALVLLATSITSCATILGGKVSECQRSKPTAGQPSRQLRAGALIADVILFWPGAVIDFATNAIYKPCKK